MAPFTKWFAKQFKYRSNDEEMKTTIVKNNLQNAVECNKSKNTLLHYAAKWNNAAITQYLLDLGSQVDAQNRLGRTPLMVAVEMGGCKDTIEILIKAGANIFIRDKHGDSALKIFGCSRSCDDTDVGEILSRNYNFPNDNEKLLDMLLHNNWYLYKIVALRNADITKLMLDSKYSDSIIAKPFGVKAALRIATKSVDVDNVKLLLDYCDATVNVNMKNKDFMYPLSYVFFGDISKHLDGRIEILKMLLERIDSLTNSEGKINEKVSRYLLRQGNKEAIEILLQHGLDVSAINSSGNTVVHILAHNENPGVIELLSGKKFDVNARNHYDETPVMIAASCGIPNAVKFLIDHGADVNATDVEGLTVLCRTIINCQIVRKLQYRACIQTLLERGANPQLVVFDDDDEATSVDILIEDQQFLVSDLVLSHIALHEELGTPIIEAFRDGITIFKQFKDNLESSKRELTLEVYKSTTLLHLLTVNEKKLERYVRNQEFYLKVNNYSETCKFDYYKTLLQKRISKAIYSVDLRKEVAYIICRMIKTDYERFPTIGDEIASYLEQEDMANLLGTTLQECFVL